MEEQQTWEHLIWETRLFHPIGFLSSPKIVLDFLLELFFKSQEVSYWKYLVVVEIEGGFLNWEICWKSDRNGISYLLFYALPLWI